MQALKKLVRVLRAPMLGFALSLLLCTVFLMACGESPSVVVEAVRNTLFTDFGLGYTLYYTTPLIFTGLAVALSFHCGLFNIGAEGQLYVGSAAIIVLSQAFPNLNGFVAIPLGILAAAVAGGIWGGLAGALKATRGSHEVIVTILLNFIGIALVDYLILYTYRNTEEQNAETLRVSDHFEIPTLHDLIHPWGSELFKSTPVNVAFFLAVAACFGCYYFLFHTTRGFEIRSVGENPVAAKFGGMSIALNIFIALFISGALAGLVGVNEIMGNQHRLVQGFSPGYGFTGIAVALMARNHPIAIILSAFLFGGLHNSSRELEFLTEKVSKELSLVLQGTLIAFVACDYLFEKLFDRKRLEVADD